MASSDGGVAPLEPADGDVAPRPSSPRHRRLLFVGALGVVYGDIGTSPIYALREAFNGAHAAPVTSDGILAVVSLVLWSLVLVVSVKYVWVVMQADDHGEGGIVALATLATRGNDRPKRLIAVLTAMGLFGAALLYGDGMITPAISVLSAVEGLEVLTTTLKPVVIPMAVVILLGLFLVQRGGTARIGRAFGPIMLTWFAFLALTGLRQVVAEPAVLAALNPLHGLGYLFAGGFEPFLILGAVFLAVTGSEALYADMGHFGHGPIARGWSRIVLPALTLQYMGQGALLLGAPEAVDAVFYRMVPGWALIPTVALATMATVIASQALISGAFSLTAQAVQLDQLPRVRILHTSEEQLGQVYVPAVNWILMVASILLVIGFGSSQRLASAYGVAVVLTMILTTLLFYVVAQDRLGWPRWRATAVCVGFLVVDLVFAVANVDKIPSGGWFPLLVGGVIFLVMTTWIAGRRLTRSQSPTSDETTTDFVARADATGIPRVPGLAIYLDVDREFVPPAMVTNLERNHVLHNHVVVVTVVTARRAHVPAEERARVLAAQPGLVQVLLRFGFADIPDVPATLASVSEVDLAASMPSYIVGGDEVVSTAGTGMARWRERLFLALRANTSSAPHHFHLPASQVIHIGRHIEI